MDSVNIKSLGKQYNRDWIFKNVNLDLNCNDKLAVYGHNGSGKSTLIQIILGYITPTTGGVSYHDNGKEINPELLYRHVSFAAPYLDLIDEFTLIENIRFFSNTKSFRNNISPEEVMQYAGLESHNNKLFFNFSSGMKQKCKIALAVLADTPLMILDEPLSNLDKEGFIWYKNLIKEFADERICIICSNNIPDETAFCNKSLNISDFK